MIENFDHGIPLAWHLSFATKVSLLIKKEKKLLIVRDFTKNQTEHCTEKGWGEVEPRESK